MRIPNMESIGEAGRWSSEAFTDEIGHRTMRSSLRLLILCMSTVNGTRDKVTNLLATTG